MKKIRVFLYTLFQGIVSLKKNVLMIFSSIYVIFVTLLIIGTLTLVSENLNNELKIYADKPEIRVDCSSDVSNADALLVMRKIEAHPSVDSMTYISKEENLEKFLELLGEDSELFKNYSDGANAFYVSFDIKLKSSAKAEQFVEAMMKVDGVEYVKDNISVIKTFEKIRAGIQIGFVFSVLVLGALSVFLASNTIRLTVEARKDSISIMKYVGASDFYISGPFVIEGIIIGVVGALLSFLGMKLIYSLIERKVVSSGSGILTLTPFSEVAGGKLLMFMIFGIAVGVLGSLFAIRKYEKV